MPNWWDLAYRSSPPLDSGVPADELMELVQGVRVRVGKVLDIGCGIGTNVLYLAEKGFDASRVDMSKVAIRKKDASSLHETEKVTIRKLPTCESFSSDNSIII